MANESIDIGSFYWTLRGADFYNHSSAWQGFIFYFLDYQIFRKYFH